MTAPAHVGYGKASKIGTRRTSRQGRVRYYPGLPEGGPGQGLRFAFTPLLPEK